MRYCDVPPGAFAMGLENKGGWFVILNKNWVSVRLTDKYKYVGPQEGTNEVTQKVYLIPEELTLL